MRRRHTLCLGDMKISDWFIIENHVHLAADEVINQEGEFDEDVAATAFSDLGYVRESYLMGAELLRRLQQKKLVERIPETRKWKRTIVEAEVNPTT